MRGPGYLALVLILLGSAAADEQGKGKKGKQDQKPKPKPMLVLGKTQLFDGPTSLPAFCKEHAKTPRSRLRKETVERLKAIAEKEQTALLEALGNPKTARRLWLVNAVVVRLTPAQKEAAERHAAVKHVYPAGQMPLKSKKDRVSEVLKRRKKKRRKFSLRGKEIPWHLKELHVPDVWKDLDVRGEGVLVAMFDSGINYRHQDLARNIWRNPGEKPNNRKDDDDNGLVDDIYGYDFQRRSCEVLDTSGRLHGTRTAGCVAGDGTGGTIVGVAPRAQLMALIAGGGAYNAALAFQYALEEGADILSMSFSIPDLGHTRGLWRLMAEHAVAAGLVLVSGAGNFQRSAKIPEQIRIPEGIPCVICIGGVNRKLEVPGFVSLGPVEWGSVKFYEDHPLPDGLIKPDVCAFPGPGLILLGAGKKGYTPEKNRLHGNSLSAPQAAGTVALMLSAAPELTPWRVKAILEETALDLEAQGKDTRTGAGLINALEAVQKAMGSGDPTTGR